MKAVFGKLREIVGEVQYLQELERAGVHDAGDFHYLHDARTCYNRLVAIASKEIP